METKASSSLESALRLIGRNLFWPALIIFVFTALASQWIAAGVSLSAVLLSLLIGHWTNTPSSNERFR